MRHTFYKDSPDLIDQHTPAHVARIRAHRKERVRIAFELVWAVPVIVGD